VIEVAIVITGIVLLIPISTIIGLWMLEKQQIDEIDWRDDD
jgi:uncharacterized membrane protein